MQIDYKLQQSMNLEQLAKNQQLKKTLENRKQQRIKQKLQAKQREQVNLDSSHLKTGKMEKSKIIQKKQFRTEVQKSRKIQVKIQDNANASTYVNESNQYLKILERTKNYIKLDKSQLLQGCKAVSAYAESAGESIIHVQLVMQKQIQSSAEVPVMIRIPHGEDESAGCVILVNDSSKKILEAKHDIKEIDVSLMKVPQFTEKYKKDKKFNKQINKNLKRVFCEFQIFSRSKLVKRLLSLQIPVFPIDAKKIPYSLQSEISSQPNENYSQYLSLLLSSTFMLIRSGISHRIKIRNRQNNKELAQNIECVIHQGVARLIQKQKGQGKSEDKGNKLVTARIKSETSIPIDIYSC